MFNNSCVTLLMEHSKQAKNQSHKNQRNKTIKKKKTSNGHHRAWSSTLTNQTSSQRTSINQSSHPLQISFEKFLQPLGVTHRHIRLESLLPCHTFCDRLSTSISSRRNNQKDHSWKFTKGFLSSAPWYLKAGQALGFVTAPTKSAKSTSKITFVTWWLCIDSMAHNKLSLSRRRKGKRLSFGLFFFLETFSVLQRFYVGRFK